MYKCKHCGKEFDNKYKLTGHSTYCEKNPKRDHNIKQIAIARSQNQHKNLRVNKHLHCKFCDKEVSNEACLAIHEKACEKNPNKVKCPNRKGNGGHINGHSCKWKGKNKYNDETIAKRTKTWNERYKNGEIVIKGYPHSEETKQHLREVFVEKIKNLKNGFKCFYSKRGCEYMNKLNEERNWNLQHAENGGEIYCIGYWVDGYDKNLNIVFEYDEPAHYKDVKNNILNDKDLQRQQNIINELHCEFWRYNEAIDLLYKVN